MNDCNGFELKMGQLVDARLQEKAPALYPYRVGYQLIDKNEEGTKGVGAMAFVRDGQWLYAPAFFIKGRLKGLDMIYVKGKDMMIPLNDGWISYIKKGEINRLGEGIGRDQVKSRKPDMIHIMLSPNEKISSERDSLIDNDTMCKMAAAVADVVAPDLMTELPKLGREAFRTLVDSMDSNKDFANAIFQYYKPEDLRKVAAEIDKVAAKAENDGKDSTQPGSFDPTDAKSPKRDIVDSAIVDSKKGDSISREEKVVLKAEPNAPETTTSTKVEQITPKEEGSNKTEGTIEVIRPSDEGAKKLSDSEKAVLMRDGNFVVDTRKTTTTVFNSEARNNKFSNPTASGLYDILLADGSTSPMMVVFPTARFAERNMNTSSDAKHAPEVRDNHVYVIYPDDMKARCHKASDLMVAPTATLPEAVYNKFKNLPEFTRSKFLESKGGAFLVMDKRKNAAKLHTPWHDGRHSSLRMNDTLPSGCCDSGMVRFLDTDGKLHLNKGMMFIPKGSVGVEFTHSDSPIRLGDVNTLIYHMQKTAGLEPIKLYSDGHGYAITGGKGHKMGLSKLAATMHLAKDYGIEAGLAKKMLAESSEHNGATPKSRRYLLKVAEYHELQAMQPGSGQRRAAQRAPLEQTRTLMPAQALRAATDAGSKGVKEVMDVSVLSALAGTSHSMELMGTYLSDMVKAMDKIGRLLFMFYWHNDEFRDQYGAQELTELEESLRTVFESTGDLILFLKEKSVDFESLFSSSKEDLSGDLGNESKGGDSVNV